jgi:predicted oxidoreductase
VKKFININIEKNICLMGVFMSWVSESWDKEADVVIVGYGGAGKISAITAHDFGADVLIMEKAHKNEAGGNTLANAGGLFFTRDPSRTFKYLK